VARKRLSPYGGAVVVVVDGVVVLVVEGLAAVVDGVVCGTVVGGG
jgi:hypothetical protein